MHEIQAEVPQIFQYAWLIILFPFIGVLVNLFGGKRRSEKTIGWTAVIFSGLAFVVALAVILALGNLPEELRLHGVNVPGYTFFSIGSLSVEFGLHIDDATASLEEAGLTLGRQVYTSELPEGAEEGEVVGQLPSAGTQVEKGTPVDVIVARGAQVVAVPNVIGMTSEEAVKILEQAGLRAKTVSVASDGEAGQVVDQSPQAGTEVVPGSEVGVMVSTGPAATLVPNVIGESQDEATSVLAGAGYKVEAQTGYDEKVEKGLVAAQSPEGGLPAEPGSTVVILVSSGKNPQVNVPAITGMAEENAMKLLGDAGLEGLPGASYSDTVPAGTVISQDPEAGATVPAGSMVSFAVSEGPKPAQTATVPDVVGKTQSDATSALEGAGYQVAVTHAYSDAVANDVVGAQAPLGDTVTPPGITVALLVSDGSRPGLEFVTVPDLTGMSLDEATATLEKAGLKVTSSEFSTSLAPQGQVFAQLPPPGYSVPPGVTVIVLVSKGPYVQVNPL
jgi:beta-lactam-binding protein with PASTA domain